LTISGPPGTREKSKYSFLMGGISNETGNNSKVSRIFINCGFVGVCVAGMG
jgi:hypothetical protein